VVGEGGGGVDAEEEGGGCHGGGGEFAGGIIERGGVGGMGWYEKEKRLRRLWAGICGIAWRKMHSTGVDGVGTIPSGL